MRGLYPRKQTPHPSPLREATFSHRGRREEEPVPSQPSSISPDISWVKLTPPSVNVIFAGSFSLPLSLPPATASRTNFSISRCEVMPTFLRKPRRLVLNRSSFMVISRFLGTLRMVQHVFAEVALAAVGARGGVVALNVAVLAAGDIFGGACRNIVGAAEGIVVLGKRI